MKLNLLFLLMLLLSACSDSTKQLNEDFGKAQVRDRLFEHHNNLASEFTNDVKPIIENRCVVCHGCYDSPCQLKLSSAEGIDRGFSPEDVYATRFSEIEPTRLFIDAKNTQQWRDKSKPFKPVLNERSNHPVANLEGSVFYKMLTQKIAHPLPNTKQLPDSFDLSLTRNQTCPSIETYNSYQSRYPLAGMPYGLPAVSHDEFKTLEGWLRKGAIMAQAKPLPSSVIQRIAKWEALLNQSDSKAQLISRYIYEHLFLGHVYFSEEKVLPGELPVYFRLVRSSTPPGEGIDEIATRRPYEDPKLTKVYYRLREETGTVLTKTHMPYALNAKRAKRWDTLFFNNDFSITTLPGYEKINNAFKVFAEIPPDARYKFMLDDAEFFIMGFIKGPSCRGQTALNLIHDKFWVFFTKPNILAAEDYDDFLVQQADNLELPSDFSVHHFATVSWLKYSKREKAYIAGQKELVNNIKDVKRLLGTDNLFSGTENSALTIFRNFDSGVVKKGLHGKLPNTAWVINYSVFERIHYLLVAGFDIYSPVKHQLVTRLYMDFLRIESEMSFITLLPKEKRKAEILSWYRDSTNDLEVYLTDTNFFFEQENSVVYKTNDEKNELLGKLKNKVFANLSSTEQEELQINVEGTTLSALNHLPNLAVQQLSQTSFILLDDKEGRSQAFTLLRHNARKNISTLLREQRTRLPAEDSAEIFKGFVGSYPQTIFKVPSDQQTAFINEFKLVTDSKSYERLLDNYGIRRTNADFWQVSDEIHRLHKQNNIIEYGMFDYNRLDNR